MWLPPGTSLLTCGQWALDLSCACSSNDVWSDRTTSHTPAVWLGALEFWSPGPALWWREACGRHRGLIVCSLQCAFSLPRALSQSLAYTANSIWQARPLTKQTLAPLTCLPRGVEHPCMHPVVCRGLAHSRQQTQPRPVLSKQLLRAHSGLRQPFFLYQTLLSLSRKWGVWLRRQWGQTLQ